MTGNLGGSPPASGSERTLGDSLRATRVAARVSVEQVEDDLRIKAKYIEAIEDGDAAALPSRAYTDGFLRNYATYLGLDPAETVRRFAGEQGLTVVSAKPKPVAQKMPKKAKNDGLNGLTSAPVRKGGGWFGRSLAAIWPFALVAGTAFAGYTGFGMARDAGLIPPQFGGIERVSATEVPDAASPAETPTQVAAAETEAEPAAVPVPPAATIPVAQSEIARVAARPDLVGDESSTGRPDTLSYARTGTTPYWQAKAPAVESADGPVSEIEPETAGVLRDGDTGNETDRASRWTTNSSTPTPPADEDASRIAAAAREALGGMFGDSQSGADGAPTTETAFSQTNGTEIGAPDQPQSTFVVDTPPAIDTVAVGAATVAQPGIGALVTENASTQVPAPALPAAAPRSFALIAVADTWVQVSDSLGSVTYTGIMSAGEAYNIPSQQGLRLKTGNAGGLFIDVDGQRFGPLGGNGSVMRNVPLNPSAVRSSFTRSQAASLSQ